MKIFLFKALIILLLWTAGAIGGALITGSHFAGFFSGYWTCFVVMWEPKRNKGLCNVNIKYKNENDTK